MVGAKTADFEPVGVSGGSAAVNIEPAIGRRLNLASAEQGARAAKALEKYSNIHELLNNWQYIRAHCVNATFDYDKIDYIEMLCLINNTYTDPETNIRSITRSKQRTEILIHHIDKCITNWEYKCGESFSGRIKRRIIRGYYFDHPSKSLHQIAKEEKKPYPVILEYRDKALKELSAIIFGADGLLKADGAMYVHTFGEINP